jgi:GT2 family glycosyltransferase
VTTTPAIATIVATHDRHDMLEAALASLAAQSLDGSAFEVVVVDNSPDQAAAAEVARRHEGRPNLRYLLEPRPGLSNARNVGAAAARAPLLHYMDDDAEAHPDLLARLIEAFEALGADAVGGRVTPVFPGPRPAWLDDSLLGYLTVVDWGGELRLCAEGEWLAGANIAFRRTALEAAGGFSRSLGRIGGAGVLLSNEETELLARIGRAGGRIAYAPAAEVRHHIDPARLDPGWFRRRIAWQAVSEFIQDPARAGDSAGDAWSEAVAILDHALPGGQGVRGLSAPSGEAERFAVQMLGIHKLTTALLAGLPEPPPASEPAGAGLEGAPEPSRNLELDRIAMPPSPDEVELDAVMERIRAELSLRREEVAAGALALDALPTRLEEFEALPEDAFVEAAHRAALGRPATPEEADQTAWLRRAGVSRAVILDRLLRRPEARARGASIPGVARQAMIERARRVVRESPVTSGLRPAMRMARGLRRLARIAPRLARLDEALEATRRAAVSEQSQRFTAFALQQAEAARALAARLAALDGGEPSPALARALAETAAELSAPSPALLAMLRRAPGPVLAIDLTAEAEDALIAAGVRLAEDEGALGAVLVPEGAALSRLDAALALSAHRLAPGGFVPLPAATAAPPALSAAMPAAAAPEALLRRLAEAHGLVLETVDGLRLMRRRA